MYFKCFFTLIFVIFNVIVISARIHNIHIKNDTRKSIRLSKFAFNKAGTLNIKLSNFISHPDKPYYFFGLTFDRIPNDGLNTYLNKGPNRCVILEKIIGEKFDIDKNAPIIYFPFDLQNKKIKLKCSNSFTDIKIVKPSIYYKNSNVTKNINDQENLCSQIEFPINSVVKNQNNYYNIEFTINMETIKEEDNYNVFFHNCINYEEENSVLVDFNLEIEEKNGENFLSMTEINLPKLYCILALLYFLTGTFWVFTLWKRKSAVLKIHILMGIVIYLKFFTIFLNYINYKYIEKIGCQSVVWFCLYFIFNFFMIIFLFVTIILIASGWTIVKTNLKRKIKIILFLVILLQVIANITKIYLNNNNNNDIDEYKKIKELYLISDLLSCILTLFPAIWTLRQLKRNSELAEDYNQLILFKKHFVLLLICIYFTRIIPYLIELIVSEQIQYSWLPELFKELTYFICFVLIGFIFRPIIKSYLTAISDDVNDIDSSIPIKDNFNKFNENWISTPNIINAIDDEEEASLLNEIKGQPLF